MRIVCVLYALLVSSSLIAGSLKNNTTNNDCTTSSNDTIKNEAQYFCIIFSPGTNGTIKGGVRQVLKKGNDAYSVKAEPNNGYTFIEWRDENGNFISKENPFVLKNISCNREITAYFEKPNSADSNSSKKKSSKKKKSKK